MTSSPPSAPPRGRPRRGLRRLAWLGPAVLTGSLLPFGVIAWRAATGGLGANPIATAMNQLGLLALLLLVASLACTPLKIVTGQKWPLRLRKILGLTGFFAVLAHFLVYAVFDQVLVVRAIVDDVVERPFIAIGFAAFVLLCPLALTSTRDALRRLGHERWQRLHRLAYVCATLGVVHFALRVKKDLTEPLVFGSVLALLFAIRLGETLRPRRKA